MRFSSDSIKDREHESGFKFFASSKTVEGSLPQTYTQTRRCIIKSGTHLFLKIGAFVGCHGVSFSDDGYDVDFVVEPLHELDVKRL